MKKLLSFFLFIVVVQFAFAGGHPVLKVELKGGLAGRVDAIISDMKDHKGAASVCFNLLAHKLSNINTQDMQLNPEISLDETDYQTSNELLDYAKTQISNNNLSGEVKKEVADARTGCKRVYLVTWTAQNRYGDKGSINISKLDTPTCLVGMVT